MQPSDSSFNKKDDNDASQRPALVKFMLTRAESGDDRRTDEQAANKLQALRDKGGGTDSEDVARSALRVKKETFHDVNAQDEDTSTVKEKEEEEEPFLIPEPTVSNEESDDDAALFDRPPFDPYNVSSELNSHFVSVGPELTLPAVSGTSPHVQVRMPPHPYTYLTPPHFVYAHQPHPSSGASSLTGATSFGSRVGEAPSYFTAFHGGYIPAGFADYRSIYNTHREDHDPQESEEEEEEDSKPAAKVRPNGATSNKAIGVEDKDQNPIVASVSKDSVDFSTCATPDGALVISDRNGTAIALIDSNSTDVAALFYDGTIRVTNLLTSGGGTEVTKLLNSPGLANVAVTENRKYARWTEEEDDTLREAIYKYNGPPPYNWKRISRKFFKGIRSDVQCKNRWKKCLQPELKRTPFNKEEDAIIKTGMEEAKSWSSIASLLPGRIAEQVRERWINILDPELNKGPWTDTENQILFRAQGQMGNQWVKIAKLLPGRSENSVKNRWHNAKMSQRRMMKRLATQAEVAAKLKVARTHNDDTEE